MIANKGAPLSYPEIRHCGTINKIPKTITIKYEKTLCLKSNTFFSQSLKSVTLLFFFNAKNEAIVGDQPPNKYGMYKISFSFSKIPLKLQTVHVPQHRTMIRKVYTK